MLTLATLKNGLKTPGKIVITTHYKPDGDALGSSLALFLWLEAMGHEVHLIVPSDFPSFFDWMPGRKSVQIYTSDRPAADALINDAGMIFCLDFNGLARTHDMEEVLLHAPGEKVMIDHHMEPEGFDDIRHWDSSAAATAQLVYDLLVNHLDARNAITADIATCLYTGIMTDTGSFRFRTTTAQIHLIIADLITLGAQNWKIHDQVFNSATESRLKFLGHCLLNRLEVLSQYNTAIFAVTQEDLQQFSITTGDTEGLVNYALSISGTRLAALIIDRSERVKLSLRSVGDIPCNEICRNHFNGGGHVNAAGGNSDQPLSVTVQRFKDMLPLYKELLTQ